MKLKCSEVPQNMAEGSNYCEVELLLFHVGSSFHFMLFVYINDTSHKYEENVASAPK